MVPQKLVDSGPHQPLSSGPSMMGDGVAESLRLILNFGKLEFLIAAASSSGATVPLSMWKVFPILAVPGRGHLMVLLLWGLLSILVLLLVYHFPQRHLFDPVF